MEILTPDNMPVKVLAEMALNEGLYHSPAWTMISCYRDIITNPDVEETSVMLVLRDDEQNCIGATFFNDEFCDYYWGTNIQMFVKPQYRGQGYAKLLFTQLNNYLKKSGWNGTLFCGYGVEGSGNFWYQMNKLHLNEPEQYCQVCLN
ncbi:hypothetical protein FDG95_gp554 [Pectobacterium phage vB_PcaM_CBB]|uniref:N-acetyltransferase domain-containing protein n=1 Tax=Pectobacterium phage vB_PcaM_CBB TaxID=2772511 RepID=A0A1L2CVE1_9CAUD|nr:hypothetical protein FDG95_gp554 [Pectobacterium phage vB_PcaM_CBB]AMM43988.1 hypothetical protein CBB_425 [Pectobacterium phage vB_PcaM_CBB]